MTKVPSRIEYSGADYGPLNQAIEREAEKTSELLMIYRGRRYYDWSRIFFWISVSVAVLVLSGAIAWWILKDPVYENITRSYKGETYSGEDLQEEKKILTNLRIREGGINKTISIDTSFTVFIVTPLDSGESVVTGKTYSPDSLAYPFSQYCYLATIGKPENLGGLKLATVIDDVYIFDTNDVELRSLAKRYCQFEGVKL